MKTRNNDKRVADIGVYYKYVLVTISDLHLSFIPQKPVGNLPSRH